MDPIPLSCFVPAVSIRQYSFTLIQAMRGSAKVGEAKHKRGAGMRAVKPNRERRGFINILLLEAYGNRNCLIVGLRVELIFSIGLNRCTAAPFVERQVGA